MEKYNKHIAENPDVEMIHVSLDSSKGEAEGWAKKEKFPWLTILPEKVKKSTLQKSYKTTRSVPEYHLIDADGNTVVKGTHGSADAFNKIVSLAKE